MKPSYLIILLAMNLCWAAVYCVYKVIGEVLPAGAIVTLRFGMAGLCLLFAWPWLPGPAPRGKDLALTFFMGALLYALGQRLQVYGNQIGTAGNSAVLMAFEPLTVSLAAGIFLREHIGPRHFAIDCDNYAHRALFLQLAQHGAFAFRAVHVPLLAQ